MFIDASELGPDETYRLLVGSVVPRPIAWVTSGHRPGAINLAPFSSFTWVSQHPAMLGFTVNSRPSGRKDTIRNIERFGDYVVNVASERMLGDLHASSEWLPPGESEVEMLGIELALSTVVKTPRIARAPISMECRFEQTLRFSPTGGEFVVGTVVAWHVTDEVMNGSRIDTELLRPVGRLAGPRYTSLGKVTTLNPVQGG